VSFIRSLDLVLQVGCKGLPHAVALDGTELHADDDNFEKKIEAEEPVLIRGVGGRFVKSKSNTRPESTRIATPICEVTSYLLDSYLAEFL
jgi:hypothetical protein